VRRDGGGTVTERALAVQLFSDPWHGDQCDGGGDDVELQVAQPGQILQMGIARKIDRHKRDDDLVHGCLLQNTLLTQLIGAYWVSVMGTFRK